jgi:hypothetical protein
MLHESGWWVGIGGEVLRGRPRIEDVMPSSQDRPKIQVRPGTGPILVNVFPGTVESILFNFATAEIVDQASADDLAVFVRRAGQATGMPVALSLEGDFARIFATYDPAVDSFRLGA